ncbi:tetratricopeptide repeat protein [Oscillatoria sp. FACHB-1407]|uniref:tetratricopeptide repeat protein n=1 Tax=Oscillatoria sp. FACHB-1407 TaxID=2692847 RepID=UPI001682A576|nr:tetratricopeptide repeat protein [Oscillatoria sp. FACHB-1407]MBD2461880.1 tetratricopeptide repeat protein [Oscillatoria sp. FACHB-1407]
MLSIVYAIALLLLVFALPHCIAAWNTRHTTMRCIRIHPVVAKDVPEHLKVIFKEAIAELRPHGFKMVSCHQIEQGSEKEEKQWGVLLQHASQSTYAGLVLRSLLDNATPFTLSFITVLEDKTLLNTSNSPFFGVFSPNPQEISQHVGSVTMAQQWQIHQDKLAELNQTRRSLILSAEELLKQLETHNQAGIERLVKTGEVRWVKPGESYRLTWWTTARLVYLVSRRKPVVSQQANAQAIASTTTAATPTVELEIEEFHRLEQKQHSGISQRGKNWLLLGTLALFVASYSPIFEPQKLLIFVAVLLLHEGGHVLAMKVFGYRDTVMLFIPFLGALATARKDNASLTEKFWISLAGPLPGLILGIALAIASGITDLTDPTAIAAWFEETNWMREAIWMLILLNLFNLLPIYPLDGGQIADLLLFSRNPYIGVVFKSIGVVLLGLLGLMKPLMLTFALLIAMTIPATFRLAKLNSQFRKDLRQLPHDDRDGVLRFLFTRLQEPPYRSLPFAQKYRMVVGLLDTRREDAAKWHVRASLTGIYLVSLLGGFAGGLYAYVPNWTVWASMVESLTYRQWAYRDRMAQEIEQADQALQANPRDEQAYLQRGRARLILEDYQGAIADANQAIQINPNSGEAYHLRGAAHENIGDTTAATSDHEKGMELIAQQSLERVNQTLSQNPQDTEAYLYRANLYLTLKRYPESLADCNQVLRIEPNNLWAVLSRGEAYLAMNQYPEALGNANHALRLNPNSADAYEFRSRVHDQMGNQVEAIADEQQAETLYQLQEESEY